MTTPAQERGQRIRVGIFLIVTILALVGTIFLLGRSQGLLTRKVTLHATYENISGLIVGAPVRLGGLDVGLVQKVEFGQDLKEKRVHVELGIERRYLERVRVDSVAKLTSKGLLGDAIINITVGSADQKAVEPGATLKSEEAENIAEFAAEAREVLSAVRKLSGRLDDRLAVILNDQLGKDLSRIARSTAAIVEEVQGGSGLLHALLYDPKLAGQVAQIVGNVDRAVGRVDHLLAQVERGPGTMHGLLYEKDGSAALADLRATARDLAAVAAELRSGQGLLHGLVYDKEYGEILTNLASLSAVLKQVGSDVEKGRGTVGALLRDPTVYEDLKTILGNVKRNRLLRTLVRYTIEKDGLKASPSDAGPGEPKRGN